MGIKSFIYTSYKAGIELVSESSDMPNELSESYVAIYNAYLKTKSIDQKIKENPNITISDYCPIKKQYSLLYGGQYFLKGSYVGPEYFNPDRYGNIFFHGGFTKDKINLPFALFDEFFEEKMSPEIDRHYRREFPVKEFNNYDYTKLIKYVYDFVNDDKKFAKFSYYLTQAIYAIETRNHHLCFYNCESGKEVWEWIRCLSMILPTPHVHYCTFDTHINPYISYGEYPPSHQAFTEKILCFIGGDSKVFSTVLNSTQTTTLVDLFEDCTPTSICESLKSLLSGSFEEVVKKVNIYRSIIDFSTGDTCIERIEKSINFANTAYSFNNDELASKYIAFLKVVFTSNKPLKSSNEIDVLLKNALTIDIEITYNLINEINAFSVVKTALGTSLNTLLNDKICVETISDSVFNCQDVGMEIVKLIYSFDNAKSNLNKILDKNIDSHIENFLKGESNAQNLHSFLSTYIPNYKESFNNLVRANYEKNKQSFIKGLLSENVQETINTLKMYEEYCPKISVSELFKIATEEMLSNDELAIAILQGNDESFKALNDCLENTGKKKLEKIEKYLSKMLYSENFLNNYDIKVATKTLEKHSLLSIVDERELIKSILKFKSFENNVSCLDFIVNSFKNLDEQSRINRQKELSKNIQEIFVCDLNRTDTDLVPLRNCINLYPTISNDIKLKTSIAKIIKADNYQGLLSDICKFVYTNPLESTSLFNLLLADNKDNIASIFFNSCIISQFTVSASVSYLFDTEGDISNIVNEHYQKIYQYICLGGIATAKEAFTVAVELISRVNEKIKDRILESLITTYGLTSFYPAIIKKILKECESQLPFVTYLSLYDEVLRTSSLSLESYENMKKQFSSFDSEYALFLDKLFQSALSFDCVTGKLSPKIKGDIETCFDKTIFYRNMLTYFTVRNDGSIPNKHIIKFLDDTNREIKEFASTYVVDNDILNKLGVRMDTFASKENVEFNTVDFFRIALKRLSIISLDLVKMYLHFCKNNKRGADKTLFTLILMNGNLRGLDENSISSLCKLASNCNANLCSHLSILEAIARHSSKVNYACIFESSPLKSRFAWLMAYEVLTRKTDEKVLRMLVESYKDEFVNAICEIMTESMKRFGKLSNLQSCYNFLTKSTGFINSYISDDVRKKLFNLSKLSGCIFGK